MHFGTINNHFLPLYLPTPAHTFAMPCRDCTNLFYLAALGLPIIIAITVTLALTTATASSKRQIATSAPKKRLTLGLFSPKGEISGFSLAQCPSEAPLTQESLDNENSFPPSQPQNSSFQDCGKPNSVASSTRPPR